MDRLIDDVMRAQFAVAPNFDEGYIEKITTQIKRKEIVDEVG